MNYLKGFALAWNMLTIIPLFKLHDFFKGINGISAAFYPLVGALLGALLALSYLLFAHFFDVNLALVLTFALWVVLTGAIHLDGLSDTIDGLFVPKERALEVMKDSHIGGMGMLFSATFLITKVTALLSIPDIFFLIPILAFARLNAVIAIYLFPYISSGVGKLVKEELDGKLVTFAFLFALVLGFVSQLSLVLLLSLLFALLVAKTFTKRYGGLSGDIYGFIIETSELFMLLLVVAR